MLTPAELLRDLLQPSAKINEKLFAYTLLLANGKVVTGLVSARTPTGLRPGALWRGRGHATCPGPRGGSRPARLEPRWELFARRSRRLSPGSHFCPAGGRSDGRGPARRCW